MDATMTAISHAFVVRITGGVQGVGYRAWTRGQAIELGLTGWVRNETDGSVTALIAGSSAATAEMLDRFWIGPAGSSVSSVEPQPTAADPVPSGFAITR